MEIRKFTVPLACYPRYSYTSSAASRMYKRFNVLLDKTYLNEHGLYKPPKYGDPTVFLVLPKSGGKYFTESKLFLKRVQGQATVEQPQTIKSFDDIRRVGIQPHTENVLVVVTDKPDEKLDWVKDFSDNTVIVSSSEDSTRKITLNHDFIQTTEVPVAVADKDDAIALAVDALLERIVFRKLYLLLDVLKTFKDVDKGHLIDGAVNIELSDYVRGMFGRGSAFLKGIFAEIKVEIEADKDKLQSLRKELNVIEDIADRYTEGSEYFYVLLYKVSVDIGRKLEQYVHKRYLELPNTIKQLFPVELEAGKISVCLQPQILRFVAIYFPKELSLDDEKDVPEISKFLEKMRPNKKPFVEGVMKMVNTLALVQEVDRRLQKIKEMYESSFHRLMWEIKGMYNRSKVPVVERPTSGNEGKKLSPKVAKRLFSRVNVAIGAGYRCDKLQVYVREKSDTDTEKVRSDIKDVLTEFHITDFSVISSKEMVTHFRRVGEKIKAYKKGTLGGFAWMYENTGATSKGKTGTTDRPSDNQNKQLCALISQHVVNGERTVYWLPRDQDGTMVRIGSIIQANDAQAQHAPTCSVDVAAATILADQQIVCDTKFRNSQRQPSNCKLYEFDDLSYLQGLPVHFYGASTELGMGTITAPDFYYSTTADTVHYVVIEDTETIEEEDQNIVHFSTMGDSGSIICADNPDGEFVDVISMLIGCNNFEEISLDPNIRGQYISFRMTDGLEKLRRETNKYFTLCSE